MTDALERLIEAVAKDDEDFIRSDGWIDAWQAFAPASYQDRRNGRSADLIAWQALEDDMTAAIAVLKAILPDHDWGRAPGGQMWVQRPPAAPVWSGDGYPPAWGLLLAILRAKLAEHVSETADR